MYKADKLCERTKGDVVTMKLREVWNNRTGWNEKTQAYTEVKEKLRMELENAARSPEEIIADEAKNALRYETSARVCRSIMTHVCSVLNKQSCLVQVFKLCYFTQSWIYYRLLNRHREHQLCTPNSSDIQIDRRAYWQTDRHTERHTGRKGGTQKAGHTDRRTDGRTHQAHLPREKYKQV